MNNLNSILIEGKISDVPELCEDNHNRKVYMLELLCESTYKHNDELFTRTYEFPCMLPELMYRDWIEKDKTVRIIGKLCQHVWIDKNMNRRVKVYIQIEHIDVRPELQEKT